MTIEYSGNKRIDGLTPVTQFKEGLKVPVYDGVDPSNPGTKFLEARYLGNAITEFFVNGTWVKVANASATMMRISPDGGVTWKTIPLEQDGAHTGLWIIYSDQIYANQNLPALPVLIDGSWTFTDTAGVWVDDPAEDVVNLWMAVSLFNGTTWSNWQVTRLGTNVKPITFTVNIFTRHNPVGGSKPATVPSNIGSYADPTPDVALANLGWYDNPPTDSATIKFPLWVSYRTYSEDSKFQTGWTPPVMVEGTDSGFYTVWHDSKNLPTAPTTFPVRSGVSGLLSWIPSNQWYDDLEAGDLPNWMAITYLQNNTYVPWKIVKVRGEDGKDGTGFTIDAQGVTGDRSLYDAQNPGFTFYDTTAKLVYVKLTAGWSDGITFGHGVDGREGSTVILSNESHIVAANSAGTVKEGELGVAGFAKTDVIVYRGATALTPVDANSMEGQFHIALGTQTGCTAVKEDNNTIYLSAVSADKGSVEVNVSIEGAAPIKKVFTFTKVKDPLNGTGNDAPFIRILASSQAFVEQSNGTISPDTVTLEAKVSGISVTSYLWEVNNSGVWTQVGTLASLTIGYAEVTLQKTYRVTINGNAALMDSITLYRVKNGLNGLNGEGLEAQYSSDNVNWHAIPQSEDIYIRTKKSSDGTWGPSMLFKGENGNKGNYVDLRFKRSLTQPSTPVSVSEPSGWFDTPPSTGSEPVWMIKATKDKDGAMLSAWSDPVRITGETGAPGADGSSVENRYMTSALQPLTPSASYSQPAGWSLDMPSTGPVWMITCRKTAYGNVIYGWTTPVRITGEKGASFSSFYWNQGALIGVREDGHEVVMLAANQIFNNYTNGTNTKIFDVATGLGSVIGVDHFADYANNPAGIYITNGGSKKIGHVGFYNGTRWTSYFDSSGIFYFGNADGNTAMQWNPAGSGLLQIGNVLNGNGLKWDGSTGQMLLMGKFQTSDSDTKIVLDPATNSLELQQNGVSSSLWTKIVADKAYPGTSATTGGAVLSRAFEAALGMYSSYMMAVGAYTGTHTQIYAGSIAVSEAVGNQWGYDPLKTLMSLNSNVLSFKDTCYVKSVNGEVHIQAGENSDKIINLHTADLQVNGNSGLNQNVVIGGVTLTFTRGILTAVTP